MGEKTEPLFYVSNKTIFQRPVQGKLGITLGFAVCEVCDGVDPEDVCALLNKAEKPER